MSNNALPAPLRVIARTLIVWWDAAIGLAVVNVTWSLLWLTIVLGPPATFGLYYVAGELVHGRDAGLAGLIAGTRRYFWQSWLWALPNLLVFTIVVVEVPFFRKFPAFVPLTAITLTGWLIVQFYGLPYFMEQETKSVLAAWRNGLLTALACPIYTLIVFACAAVVATLSILLAVPLFVGGVCLIALLGSSAVLDRVESLGLRQH